MLYNAAKLIKIPETNKVFLIEMTKSGKRRIYMLSCCLFLLPLQEIMFITFSREVFRKTKTMILQKNKYLQGFVAIVLLLAIVRWVYPDVTKVNNKDTNKKIVAQKEKKKIQEEIVEVVPSSTSQQSVFFDKEGKETKHKIFSVPHFGNTFPDQNDIQLLAANRYGVQPVENRADAESRKNELVFVGTNPYFHVDKLNNSIPYLVPGASVLLQDIGRAYFDSLCVKGIPLHKIIVTSILRTKEDVARLRVRNANATQNSCHLYGTTFDICYNRYKTVQTEREPRRQVRNDTLKWVLSEVLRDFREHKRCLVKYEVKQGCFHITVN